MLQINTPGGFFVVREKNVVEKPEVKLLWKSFKEGGTCYHRTDSFNVEEVVAFLTGESYSRCLVLREIAQLLPMTEIGILGEIEDIFSQQTERTLDLICADNSARFQVDTLRRRFQLIDDYLEDNPTETSITLPFSRVIMLTCVIIPMSHRLIWHYDALCYLNPKSNIYWFRFDLTDFPIEKVLEIASRFTKEEKRNIVNYALRNNFKLASRKRRYILTAFTSVMHNQKLMEAIYLEQYPSYLFCLLFKNTWSISQVEHFSTAALALLTWDFSIDQDTGVYEAFEVFEPVKRLFEMKNESGNDALKEFAELHNLSFPAVLPYGITLP
jgi:hypothetical protein